MTGEMKITQVGAITIVLTPLLISNLDSHRRVGDIMGGRQEDLDGNRIKTVRTSGEVGTLIHMILFAFFHLKFREFCTLHE